MTVCCGMNLSIPIGVLMTTALLFTATLWLTTGGTAVSSSERMGFWGSTAFLWALLMFTLT